MQARGEANRGTHNRQSSIRFGGSSGMWNLVENSEVRVENR